MKTVLLILDILFIIAALANMLIAARKEDWHSVSGWGCALLWCINSMI